MKEYKYTINGNKYDVAINEVKDTTAKVTVNGEEYTIEWEKPVEEKPVVKVQPVAAKPAAAPAAAPAPASKANFFSSHSSASQRCAALLKRVLPQSSQYVIKYVLKFAGSFSSISKTLTPLR